MWRAIAVIITVFLIVGAVDAGPRDRVASAQKAEQAILKLNSQPIGKYVRLRLKSGQRVEGHLARIAAADDDTTIVVELDTGEKRTLPTQDIQEVKIGKSFGKRFNQALGRVLLVPYVVVRSIFDRDFCIVCM